jgi:hypothetical protein
MPRTTRELVQALMTQWRHMEASCAAYDAGDKSEALRLATAVYNLVHDGGQTHSILSQLNVKSQMRFVTTAHTHTDEEIKHADRYTPLIELERTTMEFVPIFSFCAKRGIYHPMTELPFKDWWQKDVIFLDGDKRLTRRQLVTTLRDQEGGSHFDKELRNPNYLPLRQSVMMVSVSKGRTTMGALEGLELATMRQVA